MQHGALSHDGRAQFQPSLDSPRYCKRQTKGGSVHTI